MKRRKGLFLGLLLASLFLVTGCEKQQQDKLVVATTLFPQYDFVNQIAGDQVENLFVLPLGASAHNFEPSPSMIASILSSDVVFFTSVALEPWIEPLLEMESDAQFVDLSMHMTLFHATEEEDHEEDHTHSDIDPHYWLDPMNAVNMVETIYETLTPLLSESIESEYLSYKNELTKLDQANAAFFSTFENPVLLYGGHNSFGYFSRAYSITYITPYDGFGTDAAPTPQALFTLLEAMEQYQSTAIYTELYIDPIVATTIADETGASLYRLAVGGTISVDAMEEGVTFIDLMYQNLDQMKAGVVDVKS